MTTPVIDLKGNTLQVGALEVDGAAVAGSATTENVVDGETTVVAAGSTLTEALQDIVDWADSVFTRT
jgi:hypothetical protein